MRKPKSSRKKKKKANTRRAPRRIENPVWLRAEPEGKAPDPPIRTQAMLLPFLGIGWENFERLCLRLSECNGEVLAAWAYGKSGHEQYGIDILVRMSDGAFHVWQCKRHKSISKAKVAAAIELFLKHKWAGQAKRFVLAVACSLDSPAVVDAIEEARTALATRNIEFEALDATKLTDRLRTEPELVDDFFRRPWVEAVCPPEAVERLANRLSRFDLASLRTQLQTFYTSWISAVDPGLPIAGRDVEGRTQASIPITERYIQPDVLFRVAEPEPLAANEPRAETAASRREAAKSGNGEPLRPAAPPVRSPARERRVPLDEYLCSRKQTLIVGEAGSGKTSLLRFLALDILSEQPVLKVTRERFARAIPAWLPFALWARMSADRESPAPIEDVVAEFFRAQGEASLADEMRRAVLGKRVVLLVDGLDEASDAAAAQTLTTILTAFVDRNNIPVVASSRPHVARNLTVGSWDRSTLAPLSDAQRHALADLWFGLLERFEGGPGTPPAQVAARARRRADRFAKALRINAGIARLSQIPLFLLAFLGLHRRGHGLPRNRFAASQEVVAQLMEHQPRRREISVLATRSLSGEPRLRNRVIADFAFALQTGDLQGSIPDAAAEDRAVARAAALIRERQQNADQETADSAARAIFSFTEERAGLLVNKAPGNIGFLHLSLQEFLAARHLMQRSPAERLSFVSAHAGRARWREPILYLLFLTENEVEVGQLLEAIAAAPAANAAERVTRDALVADAVFADLAHDLGTVRRLAAALFAEVEGAAWGERRRHLLNGVVDGLLSESLGAMCREKLSEWVPDRYGYGRASAIEAIPTWVADARQSSIPALLRCLRSENEYVWRKAAETLATVANGSDDVKERLSRLARAAPSVQTAQAAIAALGCGWSRDDDVGALASAFRSHGHNGICLDAMRIRARRGETDATDLDRYFSMAYGRDHYATSRSARDLVEHFAVRHRADFVERLEAALRGLMGDRIHQTLPFLASLFICDSDNALAHQELLQALQHDWVLHDIFVQEHFPVERVAWTPPLIAKLEQHINAKERFIENDLYWISKVAPLPVLKQKFLESLRGRPHLGFWCSRALAEVWGKSDPDVQSLFTWMLTAKPETIAQAAAEMPLNARLCCARYAPASRDTTSFLRDARILGLRPTTRRWCRLPCTRERARWPHCTVTPGAKVSSKPSHPIRKSARSRSTSSQGAVAVSVPWRTITRTTGIFVSAC